jgi:probable F420-dependent oxidoreductase
MHLGIRLPHFNKIASDPRTAPKQIMTVATRAEELGFDSIWVGDHIVPSPDTAARFGTVWYEAVTTLTYAAAVTERVRLGTSVLVAPYRHPLLIGKMLATLDVLSGGRVDAGFGTGWLESEYRALGLDTFATRGQVTDDVLSTMKAAWAGAMSVDPNSPDSTYLFAPQPIQQAGIPIWIGGNSKRAARRVVEFGDAWMLMRSTLDDFRTAVAGLHGLCESRDRDPSTIILGVEHPLRVLPEESGLDEPFIGSTDEIVDQLTRFAAEGATHFLFDMHFSSPKVDNVTIEQMLEGMHRISEDVMPKIAG